ncbi:MAG TPA: hypothetical protein VNV87_12875 [Acidimicrobiales bacterium]|jgi:hypothetical protein|nr:hypothetical protein [Acidimicrobiales bacterium]
MDIEEFYSADERRRQSAEIELGTEWHDATGNRYELSWVEDTGELYIMLELMPEAGSWTPFGDVEVDKMGVEQVVVSVIGHIATHEELDSVLQGWQDEMADPDGISWVATRLQEGDIPRNAPT